VSGAPHLPAGFWKTFTSRYIRTGDLCQHVVMGGVEDMDAAIARYRPSWASI
jgi:hypothetical protein